MKKIIPEIIAYLFILLFLYTAINKLIEFSVFKEQIALAPGLSGIAPFIAIFVPAAEIIVCILLFWPAWRRKGLYASLLLMILFTGYIIYILKVDERLPCSCGGFIESLSWPQHIIFNSILILLAALGIFISRITSKHTVSKNNNFAITN